MAAGSSQSKLGKLAVGTTDPVDTFMRHVEFNPGVRREQRAIRGTAGIFYNDTNLVRESRRLVLPSIVAEPTSVELVTWLTWALGTPTGTTTKTYNPQNTPNLLNFLWFPVNGDSFFLGSVGCNRFSLSASMGEPVVFTADGVGITHDITHTSFPAISPDVTSQAFMLADLTAVGGAFTLGGATLQPSAFGITVDNFIDMARFLNSLELTRIQKLDEAFGVSLTVPAGDPASGTWSSGMTTSVALTATFKNIVSGAILTITIPAIMFPAQTPRWTPGQEGMLTIEGSAYRTGGTGTPLTITLTY